MTDLSLQSFSSIFEILLAYYIGTATSERINNIFGVEENFVALFNENKLFKLNADNLRKINQGIFRDANISLMSAPDKKKHENESKLYATLIQLANKKERLEEQKERIFDGNLLWFCLRPFYVFFGLYSLWLLILGGILDNWRRYDAIMYLNWIAFIVLITAVLRTLFRVSLKTDYSHWGPVRALSVSSLGFLVLFMPNHVLDKCPHVFSCNWFISFFDNLSYIDLHIVISVFLALSVIILHVIYLLVYAYKVYSLNKKIETATREAYPIFNKNISDKFGGMAGGIQSFESL